MTIYANCTIITNTLVQCTLGASSKVPFASDPPGNAPLGAGKKFYENFEEIPMALSYEKQNETRDER